MRVLVTGSRHWTNGDLIQAALIEHGATTVVTGMCRGADTLAAKAAHQMGVAVVGFPALWSTYGRAAGPIRNQQMLDEGKPELVLAFHDDLAGSKGTKDMVRRAERAGVKVVVYGTKPSATRSLLKAMDDM